ncbi:MAG: hypothetical protein GX130_13960 [Candidatus Hydrogenedens sp.]|nr:hypothetical protein [Candidatus Hydrogenedens sp.]
MRFSMITSLLLCMFLLGSAISSKAEETFTDIFPDTWVAADALGRILPTSETTGPPRENRFVGIFYWTWHIPYKGGPNDNTKIIAAAGDSPTIDWEVNHTPHHWGEPELGYYRMTDPFVIRKHASMLSDAGVDALFFDVTNPPHTWKNEYEALCREYEAMRQEGNRTPYICFLCPFGDPRPVLDQLWEELYKPGLWKDLWFLWEGKPLILANPDFVEEGEMRNFFTYRRPMPDYWLGPDGPDQWSWLEVYPQHEFKNSRGEVEQMSVGVAQNALTDTPGPAPMSHTKGAMGRSWHDGAKDPSPDAVNLGLNFEEQWLHALKVDPTFIFVTGWNEWIAGRFLKWHIYTDESSYYPGGMFVDQYTQEYSRDCEPMRGGHEDNYYYQLMSWIRKFKGTRPQPLSPGPGAISIDGDFSDWKVIEPEYRDTIGDVTHRDHLGYGEIHYTNDTGRNDFIRTKASFDDNFLYFYVETAEAISSCNDPFWMLLLLDADQKGDTGWLGYDFVVNLEVVDHETTTVKAWCDGDWESVGTAQYRVAGKEMELAIPRALIALQEGSPAFDFHWADNIQSFGDVSELGLHGDHAPNRRCNYRFSVEPAE